MRRGLPVAVVLTGGHVNDVKDLAPIMAKPGLVPSVILGDKGHDANAILAHLECKDIAAVIPPKRNRRIQPVIDGYICALRNLVERRFSKLKHNRRVAARYDKTADSYLGFVIIACIRLCVRHFIDRTWWKAHRMQRSHGGQAEAPRETPKRTFWARLKEHPLARVGPGLITGVADDDPSGIATYSQAGAQFGLNMLWTMPLCFPLMAAVQSMCARIGRVTGKGLAANIKTSLPPVVLYGVVALLLIANVLNIAADVAAMGEVAELVTRINRHLMTVFFVVTTLLLQIFIPYHRYVSFLKWLTLSLLAYAAVLFTVHVRWGEVALRTVWPKFTLNSQAAAVIVGVFGTTISPYLFFWQGSEEVEDMQRHKGAAALTRDGGEAKSELRRIRWDTWSGMLYSNITAFFIILATGVTLHVAGITNIETAAQAATALRPLAGDFAFMLFALGILGVGLIGVPVLAGSGAYALAEVMGWKEGLERKATDARGFYGIIAINVLAGIAIQFSPINPMKALFWSAVINGVVAVPLIVVIILLASKKSVMGRFTASRSLVVLGWVTAAVMGAAAVRMLIPG